MNLRVHFYGFILFIAFSLASCSAGRKLEVAQGQITELFETNAQLLQQNQALKNQVIDIYREDSLVLEQYKSYVKNCENLKNSVSKTDEVLKEQMETMKKVEAVIAAALMDFEEKGSEVYYKNGLVYVSLENRLLYSSGSALLNSQGKKALGRLSDILNDFPDLKVVVLGNTDDVPYRKGGDNLTLSTERANGVVRLLSRQFKVNPIRLTAAGKGQYNPVADNTSSEGRAQNRRTDIIINPDLDRLWAAFQN